MITAVLVFLSMLTLCLGVACNEAAMYANDGHMPVLVKPEYGAQVEDMLNSEEELGQQDHIKMTEKARLKWLCDIYYKVYRGRVRSVYSIGDVMIITGEKGFCVTFPITAILLIFYVFKVFGGSERRGK